MAFKFVTAEEERQHGLFLKIWPGKCLHNFHTHYPKSNNMAKKTGKYRREHECLLSTVSPWDSNLNYCTEDSMRDDKLERKKKDNTNTLHFIKAFLDPTSSSNYQSISLLSFVLDTLNYQPTS